MPSQIFQIFEFSQFISLFLWPAPWPTWFSMAQLGSNNTHNITSGDTTSSRSSEPFTALPTSLFYLLPQKFFLQAPT
jgi:hypothetical protein